MSDANVASLIITGDLAIETPGITEEYADNAGFQAVRAELANATAVFANLEIPLSTRGVAVPKLFNLRSDPAVMGDVRALGVGAVALANNHMMDFGPEAMRDTIASCNEAGIASCGAGENLEAALTPVWLSVGDARIAIISVACTLPIESEALEERAGIAPLRVRYAFEVDASLLSEQPGSMPTVNSWVLPEDQARATGVIAACRTQGADAVIVVVHWGSPSYWLSPAQGLLCAYQRPLAHALIEAGADVIIGNHPHMLHPIEVHNGRPVFYSLGNFIYEGAGKFSFMGEESLIVRLTFDPFGCELIPLLIDRRGMPRLAQGADAELVLTLASELSRTFGTAISVADGKASLSLV